MSGVSEPADLARRHRKVAIACLAFVATMIGAAYAAVPLYDLFCRVTGFGGATVQAETGPGRVIDRTFEIRFDSNVNGGLSWTFTPEQPVITLRGGEVKTVMYTVTNTGTRPMWGIASYNVTPTVMGGYFNKIQCFCFTEQLLQPGESREMPVVFFIDPAIEDDPNAASVTSVTLSYTFFPTEAPAKPVAQAPSAPQPAL